MEESFSKVEKQMFEEAVELSCKVLLHTMKELRIPNHIETVFKNDGDSYKLRIEKL